MESQRPTGMSTNVAGDALKTSSTFKTSSGSKLGTHHLQPHLRSPPPAAGAAPPQSAFCSNIPARGPPTEGPWSAKERLRVPNVWSACATDVDRNNVPVQLPRGPTLPERSRFMRFGIVPRQYNTDDTAAPNTGLQNGAAEAHNTDSSTLVPGERTVQLRDRLDSLPRNAQKPTVALASTMVEPQSPCSAFDRSENLPPSAQMAPAVFHGPRIGSNDGFLR